MAGKLPNVIPKAKAPVERGVNPLTGRSLWTGEKVAKGQIEMDGEAQLSGAVRQAQSLVERRQREAEAAAAKAGRNLAEAEAKLERALRRVAKETVEEIQPSSAGSPKKKKGKGK